jgi:hypothetical protein
MDQARRSLYGIIEDLVGFGTSTSMSINQKLDEFFQKQDSQRVDNEKIIDDLKTIVANTTNASSEGDLDSALRLYFDKKSVVENTVEISS